MKMSLIIEGKCVGVVSKVTRKTEKPFQRVQVLCETAKGGVVLYNVDDFTGAAHTPGKEVRLPVFSSPFVMNGRAYVNFVALPNGNGAAASKGGFKP